MHVIILAAGESKRFQDAGYMIPKPFLLIEWRGSVKTMLEHSIATVPLSDDALITAVPYKHDSLAREITKGRVTVFPIVNTIGPLDTAYQVMREYGKSSTLILDVDVLNTTNDLYSLTRTNLQRCAVLTSYSANPAFSYVENLGPFKRIVEKERISEYAVRGAYYVPGTEHEKFMAAAKEIIKQKKEPFISNALNMVKDYKFAYQTTYAPIEWGTPNDVIISGAHIIYKDPENVRDPSNERP